MTDRDALIGNQRTRGTRARLHQALASLIHEKNYEEIVVREILDRAKVGRSTFYFHFEDKDELLASTVRDMFAAAQLPQSPSTAKSYEKLIAFGLPLFEHIDRHRRSHGEPLNAGSRVALHEHLRAAVAGLAAEAANDFPVRGERRGEASGDLLGAYIASTFILVLDWWLDRQPTLSASEAHEFFRELVIPTLAALW
jgi:AcrR family transcriptional regulator